MCGIAGIIHLNDKPVDSAVLKSMCDSMSHRGPDDKGIFIDGPVGLGHRRLSIIDLSDAGRQPLCNEDGSIWIVCNGEIYNFIDLKKELVRKGHHFRSNTDTEVIVHLYEEYGDDCLDYLRGMFAFGLWDEKKKRLLLARDRFGIKPLFYYLDSEKLVFASELKAILCNQDIGREIDYEALSDYFTYAYVPDPKSIFKNIRKLPPAHILTLDHNGSYLNRYWQIQYRWDESLTEKYYIDQLVDTMKEAVKLHMISDVALGAFLSGGVDSSAVAAMMKQADQQVKTFSIGYNEEDFSELKYAEKAARHLGTEHQEIIVRPDDLVQVLEKIVQHFDEPFADSSAIPTYYVCKAAREFVKVILSGDGGDEAFGGYDRHIAASTYGNRAGSISRRIRKNIFRAIYRYMPDRFTVKDYLGSLSLNPVELYGNRLSVFSQTMAGTPVHQLFSEDFNSALTEAESYSLIKKHYAEAGTSSFLANARYIDTMTYLPGDNLTKVDRMSMLHSLEVRVPFLDHKVMESAAAVPPRYIVNQGQGKYILKKAMENYLPGENLYRKKMGFMIPLKNWFDNELKDYLQDTISELRLKRKDFFNIEYIDYIMRRHFRGEEDLSYQLWSLLVFEVWSRQYLH